METRPFTAYGITVNVPAEYTDEEAKEEILEAMRDLAKANSQYNYLFGMDD